MDIDYIASMNLGSKTKVKLPSPSIPDLDSKSAEERLDWAARHDPDQLVLTTSFGAQSAALLHLATQRIPALPVLFIDTGYHFPETLHFAKELQKKLNLNLTTVRPRLTPLEIETEFGRLWEMGPTGLEKFHEIIRVEPMRRALSEMNPSLWIAGLRRGSSESREKLSVLSTSQSRLKLLPILEWSDRQIGEYLRLHSLPYHPLWSQGYVSIGDRVTTKRLDEVANPSELRHFGWKRECGIHEKV
ncbi:MAG: phosphoadenylyl-sulfate reductase [Proteobacteria bacterium]|nr:phosphoadenylyl-sulfate reductase [Pseudomonadota bacterium]NBS78274.1 phosphoadenylyl-sulfate reductase [bacterium]